MAYQKTAKDKAWDRERIRFNSEIQKWMQSYRDKVREVAQRDAEIERLEKENADLRLAITTLTAGEMTPEEAVAKVRKNAELADMMKFLTNGARGMFY